MGRKRLPPKKKPKTPSEKFAARLRDLAGDRPAREIAEAVGVSTDAVLKWLRGDSVPDLDTWPPLANALGLSDCRDLLPSNL